jgi:hypothetical protein
MYTFTQQLGHDNSTMGFGGGRFLGVHRITGSYCPSTQIPKIKTRNQGSIILGQKSGQG